MLTPESPEWPATCLPILFRPVTPMSSQQCSGCSTTSAPSFCSTTSSPPCPTQHGYLCWISCTRPGPGSPFGLAGLRVNPVVAARDGYSWVAGVAPEESRGPTAELMLVVAAGSIYIEGFPHPRVEDDAHDAGSRQNCR
jgi:hypothetical protein